MLLEVEIAAIVKNFRNKDFTFKSQQKYLAYLYVCLLF